MRILSLSEVKIKLSSIVDKIFNTGEMVVITKNGKPAAILMHPEALEGLKETYEILADPVAMQGLKRSRQDYATGNYNTYETLEELFESIGD